MYKTTQYLRFGNGNWIQTKLKVVISVLHRTKGVFLLGHVLDLTDFARFSYSCVNQPKKMFYSKENKILSRANYATAFEHV